MRPLKISERFSVGRIRASTLLEWCSAKCGVIHEPLFQPEVELSTQEGKKDFDAASMWNRAIEECAVPDLFHYQATIAIRKNARKGAVAPQAGALFPDNARLRRRLASLQSARTD